MTTNFTMLCRNRPRLTIQALNSLSDMSEMNVTILDDRSADETRLLLEMWCKANDAYLVRNETPMGTGMLRNLVISKSEKHYGRRDYLCISDNDVYFAQNWLRWLVKCYRAAWDTGFRVIGGYGHPFHRPIGRLPIMRGKWVLCNVDEVSALATQSMLMSWEVWQQFGPFCTTPIDKVCQSEDIELTNRIRADGFKLGVVSPALIVSTGITNTFGERIPGWQAVAAQAPAGVIVE